MKLTSSFIFVKCIYVLIRMPWYAVAKGRKPGVYRTWDDCAKQVNKYTGAKFRKFETEAEAVNFVNEYGRQKQEMSCAGETSPLKCTSGLPGVSSPTLKINALKQRLNVLEKLYEDSMLEIRLEIDSVKTRIEAISTPTVSEDTESLHKKLSELADKYRNSVTELKNEIASLKQSVQSLETGITCGSDSSGISSFKRNLFQEAVIPVATKRLYSSSSTAVGSSKSKKSKRDDIIKTEDSDSFPGFQADEDGYVHVYTDGACEKNGKVGAKAGVGVFFGDSHPLNYSEPVQGRQTNNTAEIQAAACAIDLARKAGIDRLVINTDSQFLISCITVWIHKWKKSNWKLSDGEPVKNKEDLIALEQAMEGMNIRWNHIRGHKGNHGNEMADSLARAGARKRY